MSSRFWGEIAVLGVLLTAGWAKADSVSDDQKNMENEQRLIDSAVSQTGGTVAKKLSTKFALKPQLIQKMRDSGLGWGEIAILLSMSKQLTKTHGKDYPAYSDALKRVRSLRVENRSYDNIAKDLDLDLKLVLLSVEQTRLNLLGQAKMPNQDFPTAEHP